MTRIAILLAVLLAASPVAGEEPDEATKIAALRLAYILNGNSMVRWGSIDLSKPITAPCTNCSPIVTPPKEKLK
jgi:uncharacterized protein (DUF2062 family)